MCCIIISTIWNVVVIYYGGSKLQKINYFADKGGILWQGTLDNLKF